LSGRSDYVAEYVLTTRSDVELEPDERASWQRAFAAAEVRGCDISVVQREGVGDGANRPGFQMQLMIAAMESHDPQDLEEFSRAAAAIVSEAFSNTHWVIEEMRIRTFAAMSRERAAARRHSAGRDQVEREPELVERFGLTPTMAKLVRTHPEMLQSFRAAHPEHFGALGDDGIARS
jgi:hypothetical protein